MTPAKRIVITGASRGLGRALVREFAVLGHSVMGCSRFRDPVLRLRKEFGTPHHFEVVDVSDQQQVDGWAQALLAESGPPDLVINNAAVISPNAPLWETSITWFDELIDTNVKGVFYVARAFLPAMVQRRAGVIVNFSSGWGRSTSAEVAPYCASKWAIEGLTRALAQELPDGMAAVPFNPGIINTEMLQSCFGNDADAYPTPETWAKTVAPFLLALGPKDNGQPLSAPASA